ncbi:MAG: GAF domain-containing protein [Anaerolineales bacterium]
MIERIRQFLQLPTFDDPARNIQARNVFTILAALFCLSLAYLIFAIVTAIVDQATEPLIQALIALAFIAAEIWLQQMLRQGRIELVGAILASLFWVTIFFQEITYGGIRGSAFATFAIVIAIATLTLGLRAGIIFTTLSILAGAGFVIAEQNGALPPSPPAPLSFIFFVYLATFVMIQLVLYLAVRGIISISQLAVENRSAYQDSRQRLAESETLLQQRDLALRRRDAALQTAADLVRLSTRTADEKSLLDEAARLIAERLGYLHVGIFLAEATGEALVLRATNSEAGQALMDDNYQLRMARGELAFLATGTELLRYRIGNQIFRLAGPVPVTGVQANLSFPLVSEKRLIGLLNIQTSGAAPDREEQEILHTFADQLALMLENIRLVAQLQERLNEISTLVGKTMRQAWEEVRRGATIGYAYDRLQLLPADEKLPPDVLEQLSKGKSVAYVSQGEEPRSRLIAPLILREQVIGILGYEDTDPGRDWQENERILLETISSQVSLALENSRLVAEAQQRAEREATISEIVGRIAGQVDIESILQATVREMRRLVGEAEIAVQLTPSAKSQ